MSPLAGVCACWGVVGNPCLTPSGVAGASNEGILLMGDEASG